MKKEKALNVQHSISIKFQSAQQSIYKSVLFRHLQFPDHPGWFRWKTFRPLPRKFPMPKGTNLNRKVILLCEKLNWIWVERGGILSLHHLYIKAQRRLCPSASHSGRLKIRNSNERDENSRKWLRVDSKPLLVMLPHLYQVTQVALACATLSSSSCHSCT